MTTTTLLDLPPFDPLTAVAFLPGALCGAIIVGGFIVAFVHDPGRPVTPAWRPRELRAQPGDALAFVLPTGEHELVAPRAFQQIASYARYVPRHDWDEVPPSMRTPAWRMTAAERARALTSELGNWRWRPSRPYRTRAVAS